MKEMHLKLLVFLALFFSLTVVQATEPVRFQMTYHFPNKAKLVYRVNDVTKLNGLSNPDTVVFFNADGIELWSVVTDLTGLTVSQYQFNPNVSLKPDTKGEVDSGILERSLGERKFTLAEGEKGDVIPVGLRSGSPLLVNSLGEVTSIMVERDYAMKTKWVERFFLVADELFRAAISDREIVFIRNGDQQQALFNTPLKFAFDAPRFKETDGDKITIFDFKANHGLSFTNDILQEDQTAFEIRRLHESALYQILKSDRAQAHRKTIALLPPAPSTVTALMVSGAIQSVREQQAIDAFAKRLISFSGDSASRVALYGEFAKFSMRTAMTGTVPFLRTPSPDLEEELALAISYDLVGRPDLAVQYGLAIPSYSGSGGESTSGFVSHFLRAIYELTAETKSPLTTTDFETLTPLVEGFTEHYVQFLLRLFDVLPQHPGDFETLLEYRLATRLVQMSSHLLYYEEIGSSKSLPTLLTRLSGYLKVQPEESAKWFTHSDELKLLRQKVKVALLAKDPQSQVASYLLSQKEIALDDIEKIVGLFPKNETILRKAADRSLELLDVRKQSLLDPPDEFKERTLLNRRVLKLIKMIHEETQDHALTARLQPYTEAFETPDILATVHLANFGSCEQVLAKIK